MLFLSVVKKLLKVLVVIFTENKLNFKGKGVNIGSESYLFK